ncbi:hypothetical protein N9Y60_03120 [Crocinitomicaceae bacterium]|nr:hypothetical protein [Crocinitomicaceae bacterium]MDB3907213.1 hypothetical protein [Crocinitomicaceae bacterium]
MKLISILIAYVLTGLAMFAYGLNHEEELLDCGVFDSSAEAVKDTIASDTVSDPNNITTLSLYHDTLFLRRTVNTSENYTSHNYVYIDTNRSSKYYSWLTSFEFSESNIQSLETYGVNDVKCADDLKKNEFSGLAKNWLPVYSFNGQYYLYKPSDFGNAGRRIISDNYFIFWYMDGPMPLEILAAKPQVKNRNVLVYMTLENYPKQCLIHCVDDKRQLYVFEYTQGENKRNYYLYTPAENAQSFDMIVNTGNEKAWEYNFDPINFEKLLGIEN